MGTENVLYLHLTTFEDDAVLRGGALVVDSTTEPLEFRCTTAVRPTRLQRILWGARLDGHIATNLIGLPLIKSLKQNYSLVIVRTLEFLDVRQNLDLPLVFVGRDSQVEFDVAGEGDTTLEEGDNEDADDSGVLTNTSGRFETVILRCERSHQDDIKVAREILAPVFANRDVLEPFNRIETALEAVHLEESSKGAE